jgi:hypothetical protein
VTTGTLNWGKGRTCTGKHSHWGQELPCVACGNPTCCRDCDGRVIHKVCAEAER